MTLFECVDEGSEDFLDVYSFSPCDPDLHQGIVSTFSTVEMAMKHALTECGARREEFVGDGSDPAGVGRALHAASQNIGFIYQQFNLIPTLTVAENILLPLELLGVTQEKQQERLQYWLSAVQLSGRNNAFPDQLSGGEQQRVAIIPPG